MSDTKKPTRSVPFTSPIGTVRFAFVDKPSTKFKPDGEYSVDLLITPEEADKIKQMLAPIASAAKANAIKGAKNPAEAKQIANWTESLPLSEDLDRETGEPTGKWLLKAKQAAVITVNGEQRNLTVPVYDCAKPPKQVFNSKMGRGSEVRLGLEAVPFAAPGLKKFGVTLRLKGVQIIKLVEYRGSSDPASMGFTSDDGGYTAPDSAQEPATGSDGGAPFDANTPKTDNPNF